MVSKARKRKGKKPSFKKALRAVARFIWRHLVQLPEEERERSIAAIERAVAKKFK
jgi:hypothetical protein